MKGAALIVIAAVIGFDHASHDGKVIVSGKDAPACATCHPVGPGGALLGRPGHDACFGACHTLSPPQEDVCSACHDPADLAARRTTVGFPPYKLDPDFGLTLSHAAHGLAGAACTSCHRVPGTAAPPKPSKPHTRCASCHAGKVAAVPMTSCVSCHPAAFGANALPRLQRGPFHVGPAFDHRRHAARTRAATTGGGALACATCHGGIASATGLELPSPATATCAVAGCHDGTAAFATTGSCRRCHTGPPAVPMPVARPDAPFSHQAHATRLTTGGPAGTIDDCDGCHRLDARGEPRSIGHAACTACHAEDFMSAKPRICGACHASTEPWRALVVDRMPAPSSDFGASLDHGRHQAVACERCHSLDTSARELRPARGHVACSGSGCHANTDGPVPWLSACTTCHALGIERQRTAERTEAPWSVRARFRHDGHRTDRAGAPLPCTSCHTATTTSGAGVMPAPPAKASCAPCHDGKIAFKMTGHGCARCHGD